MAKKKAAKEGKKGSCMGGCLKPLFGIAVFGCIIYVAAHIYFLVKPADKIDDVTAKIAGANLLGVKLFPGIHTYTTAEIAGRSEALNSEQTKVPKLNDRLKNAVKELYPVTFREDELNRWLSKRLLVKQGGLFGEYVKDAHVWVDLTEGQMNVIIERKFVGSYTHVTSVLLKFSRFENGYKIQPYSAQIGQVKAPGGLARLIIAPFNDILEELSEELLPYTDHEILDIHVEEGKVTLDPRTNSVRANT